jgi:DNA invertase Pin-like site-specific DNA recombinase
MAAANLPESVFFNKQVRVALYGRVSTLNHNQDVTLQTGEMGEFCQRRGWQVIDEYLDRGISGSKDRRPELDRLMADARRRRFDVVLVYRYDRFARSLRHLVNALEDFRALGIEFVSIHEGVDTTTPNGRLVFGIFASIAEFERELIRDRVRSGLRNARAKGKRLGRPSVSVDAAAVVRLRAQGVTWRAIAKELGVGVATLYRTAPGRSKIRETVSGTQ